MTLEVVVRPATLADAPGIAAVHVDSWHTTYRGIFPQAAIEEHTLERREGLWTHVLEMPSAGRSVWVAVCGDEVIGFAAFGPLRTDGPPIEGEAELTSIYLRDGVQRAGIGRRLFGAGARWLKTAGFGAVRCKVVRGNPAIAFYQRLGGRVVDTGTFELDGMQIVEDTYRFELGDDEG